MCLNSDSCGPHGFRNSTDSTWTMDNRAIQKIVSLYVITIDNPGIAEQDGLTDNNSTWRSIGNVLQQAFVTIDIEEKFQFHYLLIPVSLRMMGKREFLFYP
jgi:hypothetical protein